MTDAEKTRAKVIDAFDAKFGGSAKQPPAKAQKGPSKDAHVYHQAAQIKTSNRFAALGDGAANKRHIKKRPSLRKRRANKKSRPLFAEATLTLDESNLQAILENSQNLRAASVESVLKSFDKNADGVLPDLEPMPVDALGKQKPPPPPTHTHVDDDPRLAGDTLVRECLDLDGYQKPPHSTSQVCSAESVPGTKAAVEEKLITELY